MLLCVQCGVVCVSVHGKLYVWSVNIYNVDNREMFYSWHNLSIFLFFVTIYHASLISLGHGEFLQSHTISHIDEACVGIV